MTEPITIEIIGKSYTWDGTKWYETETRKEPADFLIRELNRRLKKMLADAISPQGDLRRLIKEAQSAREAGERDRAEQLARRALEIAPENPIAGAFLCALLRALNRPEEALSATEELRWKRHPPLLTSRAAAFCDVGRWHAAKREIERALEVERSKEALNVVKRIKAARPDLYK